MTGGFSVFPVAGIPELREGDDLAALKGPADRMLRRLAGGTSPAQVASCYLGLIDSLVVEEADAHDLAGLGDVRPIVTRTLMSDADARRRLAEVALGTVPA